VAPVAVSPPLHPDAAPTVDVWVDVVCPWAYLGLDRSDLLRELGFLVRNRAYELHPEIPPDGIDVRPDGHLAATYARVGADCATVGLPFRPPSRVTNSRLVLEWTEAIAATCPDRHEEVIGALFAARFVDDADLGDPDVITTIVASSGVDVTVVREAVDDGTGARRLLDSVDEAREQGIVATPAWRFPGGFVVPGVHSRDQFRRWAGRLMERALEASGPGSDDR
jgi:predicted DsbA family dithiol-disulfide isomerase